MKISACVPVFNNGDTVATAVGSLLRQTRHLDEIFVVDDGSTDGKHALPGIPIVRHTTNLGRGAARASAVTHASGDALLFCDATCALAPDFMARALTWFEDRRVAAVYGNLVQPPGGNAVQRWRGRHLFKQGSAYNAVHGASLITGGCLLRLDAVRAVGNFDRRLRAVEDADLGERLLGAGFDVVGDPGLKAFPLKNNTLIQVLERYARWNSRGAMSLRAYARQLSYSIKVMAADDLKARDPAAALISILCPHFQALSSWRRRS